MKYGLTDREIYCNVCYYTDTKQNHCLKAFTKFDNQLDISNLNVGVCLVQMYAANSASHHGKNYCKLPSFVLYDCILFAKGLLKVI